jgi:hypothetical protein
MRSSVFYVLALLLATLPCALAGEGAAPAEANPSVKYALLYTGCSVRTGEKVLKDPNDKNTFWIATVKVYNQLLKNGFKAENVFVLYKDAKPDWDDPAVAKTKDKIAAEFKADYSNLATVENLRKVEKRIQGKLDANDVFVLYLTMHGKNGLLRSEHDKKAFTGADVTRLLRDNPSKRNLVFVHACFAGDFMGNVEAEGAMIGASRVGEVAWGDRDFSFGELFFTALNDAKSDADGDGKVDYREAFDAASRRYAELGAARRAYIRDEWAGKGMPADKLKQLTFKTLYLDAASRVRELEEDEEYEIPRPKNLVPGTFDDISVSAGRKVLLAVNAVGLCGYPLKRGALRLRPGEFAERRPGHGPRGYLEPAEGKSASLSWEKRALIVKAGKETAYPLPPEISDPSGLAHDGTHYLIADRKARAVLRLIVEAKTASLKVAAKIPVPGEPPEAVTFHAGRMWTAAGKLLLEFSPFVGKGTPKVIRRYSLARKTSGIAFAGKYLYASVKGRAVIYSFVSPVADFE